MRWLADDVHIEIAYADHSAFGGYISGRFDRELRDRFSAVTQFVDEHGLDAALAEGEALLDQAFHSPEVRNLYTSDGALRDDVLYPDTASIVPEALTLWRDLVHIARIPLSAALAGRLAALLGAWQKGAEAPIDAEERELWDALVHADALVETVAPASADDDGATLIGHACVLLAHEGARVLVDPFLRDDVLSLRSLGPIDAVVLTHGHPDHYDPGTLLRLGPDTPIYVPVVERESILSVDIATRLRELGFRQVHALQWWERFEVGGIVGTALPLYGEQPCALAPLHPEVRNVGQTLHFALGDSRIMMTVDSGEDDRGSLQRLALAVRERLGRVDVVFGGHRSFCVYPLQFLYSSVPAYLLFVPPAQWCMRQQLMADEGDLLDAAEVLGATLTVPYAGGGAPWMWRAGLGPALDGSRPLSRTVDPDPHSLVEHARHRSYSARFGRLNSRTSVRVLHPGDRIALPTLDVEVKEPWPYAVPTDLDARPRYLRRYKADPWLGAPGSTLTPSGDSVAAARKKSLLGLLARRYATEIGIFPDARQAIATSDNIRRRFGLTADADAAAFLADAGIDVETWLEMMLDITAIDLVEHHHKDAVDARLPAVIRTWGFRARPVQEDTRDHG